MADSKITQGKRVLNLTGQDINQVIREAEDAESKQTRQYFFDKLEGVFIWKMPSFSLDPNQVDDLMDRARKSKAIIFDLRGNSGGRVDMLLRLIGNMFPEDLKVGDEKKRKETKEIIAKSRGKDAFDGRVIVLIDSGSASASEVFSKVIQLEKRGQIFGDRSAGAVMESRYFGRQLGLDTVIFFGSSITVADLIMKDGKSLEKVGVTPDVTVIPTGQDLALRRDAGLAKAIESLGISITPEAAGAIFPDIDDED
jgi:carboxyl-terminal processing protease